MSKWGYITLMSVVSIALTPVAISLGWFWGSLVMLVVITGLNRIIPD